MTKTFDDTRLVVLFNEWVKQYAENPDEFGELLDENGNPYPDYGSECVAFLKKLDSTTK